MAASAAAFDSSKAGAPESARASSVTSRTPEARDRRRALQHLDAIAAFIQIGDEHQHRIARPRDQRLTIRQRPVDIGAATELDAHQHIDRIGHLTREIRHVRVEGDDGACAARGWRGEDSAEHTAVDDRLPHRSRLIDADDHRRQLLPRASEADAGLRHDHAILGLIVLEIRANRAIPVDVRMAWTPVTQRAFQRADHRLFHRRRELALQILHDALHDLARRRLRALWNDARQGHQRRHEVDVGLDRRHHLGLEQQALHAEPLDRVLLHHAHDRAGKILADVAKPPRRVRRRCAEPAGARAGVVERGHRAIHGESAPAQRHAETVGFVTAEQETPALETFFGVHRIASIPVHKAKAPHPKPLSQGEGLNIYFPSPVGEG